MLKGSFLKFTVDFTVFPTGIKYANEKLRSCSVAGAASPGAVRRLRSVALRTCFRSVGQVGPRDGQQDAQLTCSATRASRPLPLAVAALRPVRSFMFMRVFLCTNFRSR